MLKILPTEEHTLIKSHNRGGLWYICKEGVEIFEKVKLLFQKVFKSHVTSIDYKSMVVKLMNNVHVEFAFRSIIENSNVMIKSDLSKDLLEKLISLFLKIYYYTFAKDIRE